MPHPVQRTSCDRCHGMKLRCTRTVGGACARCAKAKATCVWTPSIRVQKSQNYGPSDMPLVSKDPSGQCVVGDPMSSFGSLNSYIDKSTFPLPPLPQDASNPINIPQADLDFDSGLDLSGSVTTWSDSNLVGSASWSSPNFPASTDSSTAPPYVQPSQTVNGWQDRFNQEWTMLSSDERMIENDAFQETDKPSQANRSVAARALPLDALRQITDLNIDLFSLASAVPQPPTCLSQPLSWKNKDFAIDRTFQLSQAFIEAIDKFYPRQEQTVLATPPTAGSEISISPVESHPSLDQASFLLILSCYQRLIEIYNDIFGNMQACMDRSSITAREDYVQMPNVKVGAFALPDSSALQITLILQLARHLLRRMGSIIRDLSQKDSASGNASNELMALTFQAVTAKETDLVARIQKLRNMLISLDIL